MITEVKPNERLKHKRLAKRMEQQEVAEMLGISNGYYSMIETGKRKPSYKVMQKIADFYGVKPDYFFYN